MSSYIGILIDTFGCLLSFKVLSQYNHSSFVLSNETSLIENNNNLKTVCKVCVFMYDPSGLKV